MTFLLDTCVISEAARPHENVAVRQWISSQQPVHLHISALTIGELYYGVRMLGDGKRKQQVEAWIATIRLDFAGRILALDEIAAARWGELRVQNPNALTVDSQIAATALVRGFAVVTRNVQDFAFPGLAVFNPWSK